MNKINELIDLFETLKSEEESEDFKIDEIKRARYNKVITADEAVDLAFYYAKKWAVGQS